jgi:hypothetical protein
MEKEGGASPSCERGVLGVSREIQTIDDDRYGGIDRERLINLLTEVYGRNMFRVKVGLKGRGEDSRPELMMTILQSQLRLNVYTIYVSEDMVSVKPLTEVG